MTGSNTVQWGTQKKSAKEISIAKTWWDDMKDNLKVMACDSRIHRTAINSKVKLRGNYTWKMSVKLKQEHQQKSLSIQCPDVRKAVEISYRLLLHSVFVKPVFCSRDTPSWTVSWKENLWDWNSFISQAGRPSCCPPSNVKALMAIQGFLQAGSLSFPFIQQSKQWKSTD